MIGQRLRRYLTSGMLACFAANVNAAPILFTIGTSAGTANQLVRIDTNTQTVTAVATIGSGAQTFSGLSATDGSNFLGLETTGGNLTLVNIGSNGTVAPIGGLGAVATGGLAASAGQTSVWTAQLIGGFTYVYQNGVPNPVIANATSSPGGLAYRDTNQTLFFLGGSFDLFTPLTYYLTGFAATSVNTPNTVSKVIPGTADGGMAWDPATDLVYLITSINGTPTLYSASFDFSAPSVTPTLTPLFSLGSQFSFHSSALAVGQSATNPIGGGSSATPEPSTVALCLSGIGLCWWRRPRKRHGN